MKKNYLYLTALLFLLCQFAALLACAQINQPVIAYVTIQGTKTGTFKGMSLTKGNEGKIECIGFKYSASTPHNQATGMVAGKRLHEPFVIMKNIDSSSPQLLQAAATNETLRTVIIEFYKKSPNGLQGAPSYKITLTNASISMITQFGGISAPDRLIPNSNPIEEVSMTFQKIEFENAEAKTTATDDWNAAQ
jgi:type VI secretion system secreted protein Hcp